MSYESSFARDKIVLISLGRYVKVKKLNIGELMEFNTNYLEYVKSQLIIINFKSMAASKSKRQFRRTHMRITRAVHHNCIDLLMGIILVNRPHFLSQQDIAKILEVANDFNKTDVKEDKGKKVDNPMQSLIARVAIETGWSKEQTLGLYPDELSILLREINDVRESKQLELEIMSLNTSHPDKEYVRRLNERIRMTKAGVKKGETFRDEAAWKKLKAGMGA